MKNIIKIKNFNELYIINEIEKTFTICFDGITKNFSFEKMNEFIKQSKGINRMHKPMSLLCYIDYKNKNFKGWRQNIIQ